MTTGLIVAIDTPELPKAQAMIGRLRGLGAMPKLGLEFFLAHGPAGVAAAVQGEPFFLDLKLHDIPNTVAGAVRSILPLSPTLLTVHAAGGAAMVAAARGAIDSAIAEGGLPAGGHAWPRLLAVTVLTSLDGAALAATGVADQPEAQVRRLAGLALGAGADGLVCSPHEVAMLREAYGADPVLVVPGIRPAGAAPGDQARVMTPREAARAGASWIVVGRPITTAADPEAATQAILDELAAA